MSGEHSEDECQKRQTGNGSNDKMIKRNDCDKMLEVCTL